MLRARREVLMRIHWLTRSVLVALPALAAASLGCTPDTRVYGSASGGAGGAGGAGASGAGGAGGGLECVEGTADCDGEAETGCEAILKEDDLNCGKCGRSCQGSACSASACAPVLLGQDFMEPIAIALDETNVYAVTNVGGYIGSVPKSGGGFKKMSAESGYVDVAVFKDRLYATNKTFKHLLIFNLVSQVIEITSLPVAPFAVAADEGGVYMTALTGDILWATPDGSMVQVIASGFSASAYSIAVYGDNLFFAEKEPGNIWRVSKSGMGPTEQLVSGEAGPYGIAADATGVYWVSSVDGSVRGLQSSGTLITVAKGTAADMPFSLATDGSNAFWATSGTGTIQSAPLMEGGAASVLVSGLEIPYDVAVDATTVYWSSMGFGGAVSKVAK
jgi:hypothetical protein